MNLKSIHTYRIFIFCIVFLSLTPPIIANSKQPTNNLKFSFYYALAEAQLMHGEGCHDQLMKLHEGRFDLLSSYWWDYSMSECKEDFKLNVERVAKQLAKKEITEEEADKMIGETQRNCVMRIIHDNWDKINKSIVKNPEKECK